jgi:uncharacterized protein (TIGR02453 family)
MESDTRRLILDFLRELEANNDREWFARNASRYQVARGAFMGLVGELISGLAGTEDLGGIGPVECVFRINRDLRFSRDKSPYKTNMGALIGKAGKKSGVRSYYFHVEPEGRSMLAGGLYEPAPGELAMVRAAIADDSGPLRAILAAPNFLSSFGGLAGDSLKTAPQGYPKDHPDIDLLRRKQFLVVMPLSDGEFLSEDLVPRVLAAYSAMRPFLAYLETVLAG